MMSLSGTNALLFLQLLIDLLTRTVVNVCAISKDFLFVSLVTNRVSLEEVCLPSFDMLNLVAICLDDENEISLNVIASFSPSFNSSPQLGDICLLVQSLNKISPFLPCVCVDAVLDVIIQSWQFRRGVRPVVLGIYSLPMSPYSLAMIFTMSFCFLWLTGRERFTLFFTFPKLADTYSFIFR